MLRVSPIIHHVAVDASLCTRIQQLVRRAGWASRSHTALESFLACQSPLVPSCLVLEIGERDELPFNLVRRATAERREAPVIVIANGADIPMSVGAMKAGAIEFLIGPVTDEELVNAMGQAIGRSRVVLHEEAELLELRRRFQSLSGRERDVLARVVAGRLNKQIGAALGISEITVKVHRGKVMRKMRAESLAALVSMSIRLKLPVLPSTVGAPLIPVRFDGTVPSLTWHGTDAASHSPAHRAMAGHH